MMLKYVVLRIGVMVPLLFVVLFITFGLGKLAPGDPIEMMYLQAPPDQGGLTQAQIDELRHRYGLDRPFLVQFTTYVSRVLRGDLGTSITQNRPVLPMILRAFPVSAQMGLLALVGLIILGVPLGILAAIKQNTATDYLIVGGSLFLRTMPVYVLAPILLLLLVLKLKIGAVPHGWTGIFSSNVVLPVFLLMMYPLAVVIRQMRASLLEVLSNDYIRTAPKDSTSDRLS
jgi:peptide/nickel transport system permease protein